MFCKNPWHPKQQVQSHRRIRAHSFAWADLKLARAEHRKWLENFKPSRRKSARENHKLYKQKCGLRQTKRTIAFFQQLSCEAFAGSFLNPLSVYKDLAALWRAWIYALYLGITIGAKKKNNGEAANPYLSVFTWLSRRAIVKTKHLVVHLFWCLNIGTKIRGPYSFQDLKPSKYLECPVRNEKFVRSNLSGNSTIKSCTSSQSEVWNLLHMYN